MKTLVLGHNGMLGNAVFRFLHSKSIDIITTDLRWPNEDFKILIQQCDCEYIINCIGSIPQRKSDFSVNHELPVWLDKNCNSKIIHPGTDCEVDNDPYGLSKKKSVDYITNEGNNTKILKTSIIGHELTGNSSLLDWFLHQDDDVRGYNNHFWNGNTTLQWSKICFEIMKDWQSSETMTVIATEPLSKFELLSTIAEVYQKEVSIQNYSHEKTVDNKCLVGMITVPDIRNQLVELKKFYKK